MSDDRRSRRDGSAGIQQDLREQIGAILLRQSDDVTADTVAMFPYTGTATLDPEYCGSVGQVLVQLLAAAVRDGRVDPRGGAVAHLRDVAAQRALSMAQLFTFAYLTERTALDELAVNPAIGTTSEDWPLVAQLVRRGSFDMLAAVAERAESDPGDAAIIDALTTLYTRPVFDAVLVKELDRATRLGYPMALIVFDVDRLAAINETHGYGVGDKILERLGILIRKYFRQHDWVARHRDAAMAVLLIGGDADHAAELAERVRATVEERLGFTDHVGDAIVPVTVSASVVTIQGGAGTSIDPERLLTDSDAALHRAKQQGRNRVESVSGTSVAREYPH